MSGGPRHSKSAKCKATLNERSSLNEADIGVIVQAAFMPYDCLPGCFMDAVFMFRF